MNILIIGNGFDLSHELSAIYLFSMILPYVATECGKINGV